VGGVFHKDLYPKNKKALLFFVSFESNQKYISNRYGQTASTHEVFRKLMIVLEAMPDVIGT